MKIEIIENKNYFPVCEVSIQYDSNRSLVKLFRDLEFPKAEMIFLPLLDDLESDLKENLTSKGIESLYTDKPNRIFILLDANKMAEAVLILLESNRRLNFMGGLTDHICKPILGLKTPPVLTVGNIFVPYWVRNILDMGLKFIPYFNLKGDLYPFDFLKAINSSGLPPSIRQKMIKFAKSIRENILLNHLLDDKSDKWSTNIKRLRKFLNEGMIELKPSDKGGRIVLMKKEFYSKKCLKLLNIDTDYELAGYSDFLLSLHILKNCYKKYSNIFPLFLSRKQINTGIQALGQPRLGRFYGLPKVHKSDTDPPMRPVVSLTNHPTNIFAVLADNIIQKYIWKYDHIVQSTDKMISILNSLRNDPNINWNNMIFVACDVTSLYTSIPLGKGVNKVLNFIKQNGLAQNYVQSVLNTLPKIMYSNFFEFNGRIYRQKKGVAMGSPVGPSFANVYLLDLDQEFIKYDGIYKYFRYIDDIFMIVDSKFILEDFLNFINNLDENIKFTVESSGKSVNFLDTTIYIEFGGLHFQLFEKPIASLSRYIPSHSAHTPNMSKSIISGVIVRCLKLCSNKFTALLLINRIKTLRFSHNRYELNKLPQIILKYVNNENNEAKNEVKRRFFDENTIIAVSPSHPYIHIEKEILIKPFNDFIKEFFGYERVKLIPIYTKSSNLCEYLVRAAFELSDKE